VTIIRWRAHEARRVLYKDRLYVPTGPMKNYGRRARITNDVRFAADLSAPMRTPAPVIWTNTPSMRFRNRWKEHERVKVWESIGRCDLVVAHHRTRNAAGLCGTGQPPTAIPDQRERAVVAFEWRPERSAGSGRRRQGHVPKRLPRGIEESEVPRSRAARITTLETRRY